MPLYVLASSAYGEYSAIAIVALFSIALVYIILTLVHVITRVINKIPQGDAKRATYECGEAPIGEGYFRINSRFFMTALIFIVFEVELALMMPVLQQFGTHIGAGHGMASALKIFIFAGTLLLGLIYAARKGDFSWNKDVSKTKTQSVTPSVPPAAPAAPKAEKETTHV